MTIEKLKQNAEPLHEISERLPTLAVGNKHHEYWEERWVRLDDVLALEKELRENIKELRASKCGYHQLVARGLEEVLGGVEHAKKETEKQ